MKKILTFIMIFVLLFIPSVPTSATASDKNDIHDLNPDNATEDNSGEDDSDSSGSSLVKDDEGHLTGEFYFNASYVSGNGVYNITDSYQLGVEIGDNPYGGYLYLVKETTSTDSNYMYGLYGNGKLHYILTTVQTNNDTDEQQTYTRTESDINLGSGSDLSFHANFASILTNGMPPLIDTNIPIFSGDNQEAIKVYEETGDASGAENYDKYRDEYDKNIPIPHNLKVIKGTDQSIAGVDSSFLTSYNKDIVLSWDQDDLVDNLQFEIEGCFFYKRLSDSNYEELQEMNNGYKTVVQKTAYGSTSSSTVQISKATLNGFTERGYQTKVIFRVRNVIGNKTSNWVLVTIDLVKKTATATEQSFDDNTDTGGDEYNDNNVDYDSDNPNSTYNSGDISIDGLMSYIKSGFGLLGSGGLIALISSTFSYIPSSVWVLIRMSIALSISLMVLALVKRFVFG